MIMIMKILNAVLSVYMILLIIRVMLTWFRSAQVGSFYTYLARITDPYLNLFRRFSFLRIGMMDFSPILGFVILGILINIINSIATYGSITIGIILAILISGIWSIISVILFLMIILSVIRLIAVFTNSAGFLAQMSAGIDAVLEPITSWVRKVIFRNKFTPYSTQLGIALAILIAANIGGKYLFGYLMNLAAGLPF